LDFKKNIENEKDELQNLFYLGLAQYYKGKVRVSKLLHAPYVIKVIGALLCDLHKRLNYVVS